MVLDCVAGRAEPTDQQGLRVVHVMRLKDALAPTGLAGLRLMNGPSLYGIAKRLPDSDLLGFGGGLRLTGFVHRVDATCAFDRSVRLPRRYTLSARHARLSKRALL
jgi:hypothetical protein